MPQIDKFIKQLQRRLNYQMVLREICNAGVLFLSGTLLTALIYVLCGYRVNCIWYFIPLAVAIVFFMLRYVSKYCKLQVAADYADRHFDLKNALVSELDFTNESGAFHELRRQQTKSLCSAEKIKTIKFKFPRKILLIAAGLLLLTSLLSIMDDSERVKNARNREERIEKTTEELNKELKKKFADMLKKLKPKEKKMLKKSGLVEAVKKLNKQKELKKALRQYGKLEREIKKFAARMKMAEKERLLRMMAQKLMKSKMTRQFGQKLNSGKYREAAKELRRNKLNKLDPKNKLEQMKKLRMKRILEKMLESAKDAGQMSSSLSKELQELLECLGECKDIGDLEEINCKLCKLCDNLDDLDDAKKFLIKLKKMCKACNKAQSACRCSSFCLSDKAGKGKGIGAGFAGNFDNKSKDPNDKGYVTGLKGQKNKGSSRIKIEEAASGHGVSRRAERSVNAQFKRQMESFISRDDVPPAMKTGIKEYFTKIHKQETVNE
jgi:hypothetical protein